MDYKRNVDARTGRYLHPPAFFPDSPEGGWYGSVHGRPETAPGDWTAWLRVMTGALPASPDQFKEMWAAMPPPTPNPMNLSGPPIKRRQCSWGPTAYVFAGQVSRLMGPVSAAPELVREAVEKTRRIAPELLGPDSTIDLGRVDWFAHCNWYPDNDAALQPHQDDESIHVHNRRTMSSLDTEAVRPHQCVTYLVWRPER